MAFTYARLHHGEPLMVDHTPSANVSAGDVIKTNASIRIAHRDIPANAQGELAAGGAVYEVPKASGSTTAIADDKLVYWDDTNKVITETASGNTKFGYTVGASLDADTTQKVRHCVF